ncbi:unnamed protein product [Lactuca saligna]|uniref:SRR1-like domain-containing protein n=1 Tax=Lactuca saligna TaxID=75948 RepID=A0AA35ZAY5_LACSI|nr:unnamed protein product [Lactuca saligna]
MAASAETLKCEHHKTAEDDDWTIVLRKRTNPKRKFPKLKPSKQQQEEQQTQWAPPDIETTPEKELHLMNKMKISIEKLEKSQFFNAFLDQIHTPEASQHFLKLTQSQFKVKMVIYGIGSIESFESPRLQLSLAILMKRKLDWIGDMEVFDPIISLTESKVMEELGCRVLSVNEQVLRNMSIIDWCLRTELWMNQGNIYLQYKNSLKSLRLKLSQMIIFEPFMVRVGIFLVLIVTQICN